MSQATPIVIERPRAASKARFFLVAGRIALGLIFLYAAYAKLHYNGAWHLRDYYFLFAMGIDSYRMLPLSVVEWMARILPWLELALGTLLVKARQYPQAKDQLDTAIRLDPNSLQAHYQLGILLGRTGKQEESQREIELARSIESEQRAHKSAQIRLLLPE